jgi:hypothetical protein
MNSKLDETNILTLYPNLIDGFIQTYLSTEDATIENMPIIATTAFNKITDTIQNIINSKVFKMPQLEFIEMEYISVSWIKQSTLNLTNENILQYAISINNKTLFKFVIENTNQSDVSKIIAFSQLIKSIDKISEENRNYFLKAINLNQCDMLLPINITAYATNNITGVKFLEENNLDVIQNDIIAGREEYNGHNLSDLFPILLKEEKSPFAVFKKEFMKFYESIISFNRIDVIKSYCDNIEDGNEQKLITELINYSIYHTIITGECQILLYLLQKFTEYINTFHVKINITHEYYKNIGKLFDELNQSLENNQIDETIYEGIIGYLLKLMEYKTKKEYKSLDINSEEAKILIKAAKNKLFIEQLIEMPYDNILDIINITCKNTDFVSSPNIFITLMAKHNIKSAEKWLSIYEIKDSDIILGVKCYISGDVVYTIRDVKNILNFIKDKNIIKELLPRIYENNLVYFYENYINDINYIPQILERLIKKIRKHKSVKEIIYLSSLI